MVFMAQVRPYRGVEAPQRLAERRRRLLEAGLELLGADNPDLTQLTVRAICGRAGLTARYFYESFTDKDDFVGAVFDWVITDIAATTQVAVAAAPAKEQSRAGMANLVRIVDGDPRVGRLVFSSQLSNSVLVRKRAESGVLFAMLSGRHISTALRKAENERIKATAHFVVGGVAQTLSAWLSGDVALGRDQLVDQLTAIVEQLSEPKLVDD
jgi:AcrR family transcriptional regulator